MNESKQTTHVTPGHHPKSKKNQNNNYNNNKFKEQLDEFIYQ